MLPVKLITFDITGTLLSFRSPVLEKYIETGLKFGVKADPVILAENFRSAWKVMNEEHPNFGRGSGLGWQNWWARFVEKTFNDHIKSGEKTKISGIVKDLIHFYATKEAFIKRDGADELLNYLKQRSVLLGVISNYDPRLSQILEITDLKNFFDFVLISYEIGYCKPDARIFLEALRLGGALGRETIHVGNNFQLDYLAAKEAGLRAVLVNADEKVSRGAKFMRNELFDDLFQLKANFKEMEFR